MKPRDDQEPTVDGESPTGLVTETAAEAAIDPAEEAEIIASAKSSPPGSTSAGEPMSTRWIVLGIVGCTLFMSSLDATIVATALHTISHDLHARLNWSAWTISGYSLGRIISLPTTGKIGDKYGRRRIYILSTALFGVSSLACGLASNIYLLDLFRLLQALGGGAFIPSTTAIIATQFGRDRDRAVALFGSIIPIGGIVGPIFGGLFVAYWSWRGIFFINVPLAFLTIPLALKYIPEQKPGSDKPTDYRGVALFSTFLILFTYAITELGNGNVGLFDPSFYAPGLVSLVFAYLFLKHIRVIKHPLIPVRFLIGHGFGPINVVNLVFGSAVLGFGALVPLYAQDRFHVHVLSSGVLLTTRGIGALSLSAATAYLLRKVGTRLPMMVGFGITATGLLMATFPAPIFGVIGWLAICSAIAGVGMGITTPATGNAGMHLAPEEAGAIGGLRAMFRNAGSVLGISIASAIIARSSMPGATEGHIFFAFALICFATVPFVLFIPDGRGRW